MPLTSVERHIVERLKQRRVERFALLSQQLRRSTKTVHRALAKVGYFTSVNHNGAFVTLAETPQFDEQGLWMFRDICFSKHGCLAPTIAALIQRAPQGCTVHELEQLLGTRVHNHVSQLIRNGHLARFSCGRHAVYLSSDPRRQAQQQTARQQTMIPAPVPPRPDVPPGLDAVTVIRVLVRLLETPEASVASVARTLQARKVAVRADLVHQILDFYRLKKTTQ
jgi:hypothetical protein